MIDEQRKKFDEHVEKVNKLMAFSLYKDHNDIAPVKRMYPNYVEFVLERKDKTPTEVKNELFPRKS